MTRIAAVLCCLAVSGGGPIAASDSCILGPQPAASLLIPYFEVDLDEPGGRTTLFAVSNTSAEESAIARVVLWTDWGIPTLAADIILNSEDIQTINLRDIFAGSLANGSIVPIQPETLNSAALARLKAKHTGIANPGDGLCYASPRSEKTLATGYVTVDLLSRSSRSVVFQTDSGYFQGTEPLASQDNRLAGDFFLVEPDEAFAQGFEAVHLVAQPERFSQGGGPTFYGAFVAGSGADGRLPLSTRHKARFLVDSPAVAGTKVIIWLDNGVIATPQECGDGPPWFNFGIPDLKIRGVDEEANEFSAFVAENPVRTQVFAVGTDIPVPAGAGELDVQTQVRDAIGAPPNFDPVQGWIAPVISASGLYSVGWNAIRMDDGCITLAD